MLDQPRFGRIPDGVHRSGLCRGELYKLAAIHHGLFRKHGAATIVDLQKLDEVLAELPAAQIGGAASSLIQIANKLESTAVGLLDADDRSAKTANRSTVEA